MSFCDYTLERDGRELQHVNDGNDWGYDYTLERDGRELQPDTDRTYSIFYYTLERDGRELQLCFLVVNR